MSKRERELSGARGARSTGWMFRLRTYGQRHIYALLASLGQLWRSPLATLMTTFTLAVTLALPAGLYLIVKSTDQVTATWQGDPQISLYLKPGSTQAAINGLVAQLEKHPAVEIQAQITPEDGMARFSQSVGMVGVLDVLGDNPLPYVIVLRAKDEYNTTEQLAALAGELRGYANIDLVQIDLAWLEKLNAIVKVFEQSVTVIAVLLALAVFMTIGNTVRLSIQNRYEEIEVMKLVGAKDAFIRRPFLYGGFWLGLISGVLALLLLLGAYQLLAASTAEVLRLYAASFHLPLIAVLQVLVALLLGAALLGWLGAWLAVGRQLHRIDPR